MRVPSEGGEYEGGGSAGVVEKGLVGAAGRRVEGKGLIKVGSGFEFLVLKKLFIRTEAWLKASAIEELDLIVMRPLTSTPNPTPTSSLTPNPTSATKQGGEGHIP